MFSLNEGKSGKDSEPLNRALKHYFQAIDNLEKFGVVEKKKEKGGLFNIDVETSLGEDASAAATGFDKEGEQKLIFHYIGKIFADFGEYDQAVKYFKKKLALIPDNLDPAKNIPVILEKALLQNQVGNYLFRSGKAEESLPYFKDSFSNSKALKNRRGMAVNAANMGRMLLIRCRNEPLVQLRGELQDTVSLFEATLKNLEPVAEFGSPEYVFISKKLFRNFLPHPGIPHASRDISDRSRQEKRGSAFGCSRPLQNLTKDHHYVNQSIHYFEEALEQFQESGSKNLKMESALQQNLDLIYHLSGRKDDDEKPASPSLLQQWQVLVFGIVDGRPRRTSLVFTRSRKIIEPIALWFGG